MATDPTAAETPVKSEPFDAHGDIHVPRGIRLFSIAGVPVVVPGPGGTTRVYVHPDDLAALVAANAPTAAQHPEEA